MNNFSKKIVTGFAFAASFAAMNAMAATQGSLGADSTATSDITLEVADRVQITSVEDITLGAWSGSGNLTGSTDFCVYRSGGDDYQLTLTADTGAFQVDSATASDSIAFTAKVDDDLDASDGESLAYNTATSAALAGSSSFTCGGSDNAQLEVTFAEAALQAASTANDYQATVTLLVEPI
ncbi:MAG: hypothetical protein KDI19_07130 [Pseudomonadales bacterium]|nr:hypothetical protein [Pseudomonadales bacterium]